MGEPATVRVADRARGLRDQRERTPGRRIPLPPSLDSASRRIMSSPATSSTAVNVWPCATPNSDIRAIRGCSRLPYDRGRGRQRLRATTRPP